MSAKKFFLAVMAAGAGWMLLPGQVEAAPSKDATTVSAATEAKEAQLVATIAKLTQSNQEWMDILKKQQDVLQDLQYDRRLEMRQVSLLEERLEEELKENTELQKKVEQLESQISVTPTTPPSPSTAAAPAKAPDEAPAPPPVPAAPKSYLPAAQTDGEPGTKWWHRLFTVSGNENKTIDNFRIQGRQWRVVWHNQDQPGDAYVNTSALFINAVPQDDTVPLKVCAKLGSGGDATELAGPGKYSLKVEASGGNWELAVEDFQ